MSGTDEKKFTVEVTLREIRALCWLMSLIAGQTRDKEKLPMALYDVAQLTEKLADLPE